MRAIICLVGLGAMASCTTAPEQMTRTPRGQQQFERLVAGKVAGPPLQCLQSYQMNDMVPIDDSTIAYREGGNRVYIAHMQGGCGGLAEGAILVTHSFGGGETCRGDIARTVDPASRMTTGSCVFGEFTPYTRPS